MSLLLAAVTGQINYTLICSAGSYAYVGQSGVLTVARKLALATGSYSYTGSSASFEVSRKLALAVGAYGYTGNDATLLYVPGSAKIDYVLALLTGDYSYAGNDAALLYAPGLLPSRSMGEYGVSLRRKRTLLEAEVAEASRQDVLRLIKSHLQPVELGASALPLEARLNQLSKRDLDVILIAILASEL